VNIGILGWWREGNQGDFAIRRNLEQGLAPHRVVPIDLPFELTRDEVDRLNLLDFLILGGGGLFQDTPPIPFDSFEEWGPQLKTPIGVVGVGIDAVTQQYRSAVNALVEQARFFYVRDRESQNLVQHPNVQVMPDLSFLYPFPQVVTPPIAQSQPVCGVNLRTFPSLDVDQWIKTLRQLSMYLRGIPFSTYSIWHEAQTLRQLDPDCPSSFDAGLYQGLDLMIGTAFHSVVFAIQAAIPTIAIAGTPKVCRLLTELGLSQWILGLNDWDKLPELVQRALENRTQLADQLHAITTGLTQAAQRTFADIRDEIDRTATPRACSNPKVSIIVTGSASDADNQLSLVSCLDQSYDNLEIIFVGDGSSVRQLPTSRPPDQFAILPVSSDVPVTRRLNQALTQTAGRYVSWVAAGDYYASDAIGNMVAHLEKNRDCDMVFTDYYTLHAVDYIAHAHKVDSARKLFRGNIVGPCFLFRRELGQHVGSLREDTPYTNYDYWLRAGEFFNLSPIHARLFFTQVPDDAIRDRALERQTRRRWRSTRPWPVRVFWRLADADSVDRYLIRPMILVVRKFSEFFSRGRYGTGQ
jgi:polysaccharide pyruvyl transferase WcaK-like protein